jgi:hypothetical protein
MIFFIKNKAFCPDKPSIRFLTSKFRFSMLSKSCPLHKAVGYLKGVEKIPVTYLESQVSELKFRNSFIMSRPSALKQAL